MSSAFILFPASRLRAALVKPSRCPRRQRVRAKTPLPPSVAAVNDGKTGAQIYVVGCVHGSQVSADDVKVILDGTCPDAVVLELCQPRLDYLKTTIEKEKVESASAEAPKLRPSFKQISAKFGGAGPALVAILLELSYGLQVAAGVQPGIEFSYPISASSRWSLVCGDAPASDTVSNLYKAFSSPLRSLRYSLSFVERLFPRLAYPPKGGISIPRVFLSEPRRLRELAKLVLPAFVLSSAISLAGTAGATALESTSAISAMTQGYASSMLPLLVSVGQTFLVTYIIISTLHFMKVLIADRDRILAQSILDTALQLQSDGKKHPTVCAVVGLLHVNGIVRSLQEDDVSPA